MSRVVIKGLAQYGVVTDTPSFETPANAWSDVRNCSFINGYIQNSGVKVEVMEVMPEVVTKIYCKRPVVYSGTKTKLYRSTALGHEDCSRATAYNLTDEWYFTEISNVIIASNAENTPQMLLPNATKFQDLTAWGKVGGVQKTWSTSKIRTYKDFLIAVTTIEDGTNYPQRIRWSTTTVPNSSPTTWDETDTTQSAGFNDLSNAKGEIVDAIEMGDYMIIYTTKEVFLMSYVGGNDIFTFRKIFDELSILSDECAVQINGGHFLVTTNDIVIHNGSTWKSIIQGRVRDEVYRYISAGNTDLVKVQYYPAKQEVWVLYPTKQNEYLDRAAIYSINGDNWTYRELPNVSAVSYGRVPSKDDPLYELATYEYDDPKADVGYNSLGQDFVQNSLFVSTDDKSWWVVDEGSKWNSTVPNVAIKYNVDFDDYGMIADVQKRIDHVYPQVEGNGTIYISVGWSNTPNETPNWSTAIPFQIGEDRKCDFNVVGRYISIKFESSGTNSWKMSSYSFEAKQWGNR